MRNLIMEKDDNTTLSSTSLKLQLGEYFFQDLNWSIDYDMQERLIQALNQEVNDSTV